MSGIGNGNGNGNTVISSNGIPQKKKKECCQ